MPKQSPKTTKFDPPAIYTKNLGVRFGDVDVLHDISFQIEPGNIVALLGPNGSGKTTLVKALLELVPKSQGEVLFFGKHLHHSRDRIGYVPQRFTFPKGFPITVAEFMRLSKPHLSMTHISEKLEEVGLPRSVDNKLLGTLSGGQLQRVLIAQAIIHDPDLLFLDEPSTGIDIVGEAEFYKIIETLNQTHGTTILLVSHDVGVVSELVDQVICVNKRLLCTGPPKKALTQKKLTELYGEDAKAYKHHQH